MLQSTVLLLTMHMMSGTQSPASFERCRGMCSSLSGRTLRGLSYDQHLS